MWIALSDGFLSIVKPRPEDVPAIEHDLHGGNLLMVRARKEAHLTALFVGRRIYHWPDRDYPCRVFVDRKQLGAIIGVCVFSIDYGNFKDSVDDEELHDAYLAVWQVMLRYQHGGFRRTQMGLDWLEGLSPEDALAEMNEMDAKHPGWDIPETDEEWFRNAKLRGPGRAGPYDTGDDADDDSDASSHLRVPPK